MNRARFFIAILLGFLSAGLSAAEHTAYGDSITVSELPELNIVAIKQPGAIGNQAVSATKVGIAEVELDNIVDIKSLSDVVPNFYIPVYGSRITSTIYVRGIGARMDQPSVGLTVDNLPVLNKDAYDLEIPDIAEVEMLRGPQSSLYGRNTMTGLINIRTLSPMNFQGVRLRGEGTVNGSWRLSGGWYHKFNRRVGLSATLELNSLHGDYRNSYNNSEVGREESGSARVKFEWLPSSRLSILNTFSTSLLKNHGYAYASAINHVIEYNDTCFYRRFLINDALTVNYNFDSWKLTGIATVQHINDNMSLDQDFLPDPYFTLTQKKQETDFTAELLAQRREGHPYHWLFGAFSFYRHLDMQAPVTFREDGISNLIEYYRNKANPFFPIKWDYDSFLLDSDFRLPSFGVAAYHESRLELGKWLLTGALRLDYERVTMNYHSFTTTSYTIYDNPSGSLDTPFSQMTPSRVVPIDIDDSGSMHMHFLTFLPKVSAVFRLPASVGNLYASFGKGYKAGGYNTQMFSDVLQQRMMNIMGLGMTYSIDKIVKYKPEYSFNYEIGSHLDFRALASSDLARLSLDLSLFYIDCRDQQLTQFPAGDTTGRIMTNAGRTRSFGGELSLSWNPWSTLAFNVDYGYTNARFVRYNDGKEDYKGKRLPYAPSNTLYLQALYTLHTNSLGRNALVFDLNMRGTGDIFWNEANSLRQNFYALLGASVSFKAPKWELQLYGRNLTNTEYFNFYFVSMGNEFLQRGVKVNAGLVLRVNI
ncbi:MAG: TonB-dependent receptor [Muribaculaceae bacterium]|nr:TonB-dependent receptor [Muribaculaceae bacterium]